MIVRLFPLRLKLLRLREKLSSTSPHLDLFGGKEQGRKGEREGEREGKKGSGKEGGRGSHHHLLSLVHHDHEREDFPLCELFHLHEKKRFPLRIVSASLLFRFFLIVMPTASCFIQLVPCFRISTLEVSYPPSSSHRLDITFTL